MYAEPKVGPMRMHSVKSREGSPSTGPMRTFSVKDAKGLSPVLTDS